MICHVMYCIYLDTTGIFAAKTLVWLPASRDNNALAAYHVDVHQRFMYNCTNWLRFYLPDEWQSQNRIHDMCLCVCALVCAGSSTKTSAPPACHHQFCRSLWKAKSKTERGVGTIGRTNPYHVQPSIWLHLL